MNFLAGGQFRWGTEGTGSIFQFVSKFLDNRIGEHFAGNALHFGFDLVLLEARLQSQEKILALAYVLYSLVVHLLQRALNGLALRIKNRGLESDVNVSLHLWCRLYGTRNDKLAR